MNKPKALEDSTDEVGKTSEISVFLPICKKNATVLRAKGKHTVEANRLMDGDPHLYLPAMMAVTTRIDGNRVTLEELLELDIADYNAIMEPCNDLNFM